MPSDVVNLRPGRARAVKTRVAQARKPHNEQRVQIRIDVGDMRMLAKDLHILLSTVQSCITDMEEFDDFKGARGSEPQVRARVRARLESANRVLNFAVRGE